MFRKLMVTLLCLALLSATACTAKTPAQEPESTPGPSDAQTETTPTPAQSAEPEEPMDMSRVSDALLQMEGFSVKLLQNLKNAYTDRNALFSPLGLNASMASLYAAAEGDTEEELRLTMGYLTEPEDTVSTLKELITAIDGDRFSLGNSLHLSKRVGFSEKFIDSVTAPLRIGTYSQDYADQATFQSINACAELLTNGKVSSVLTSTAAADTLYLITAFNLTASFDAAFDPSATKPASFETPMGLVATQMMSGDFLTGYAEDEYMQMVSLPMEGGSIELKLILPREGGEAAFDEALIQYADQWLSQEIITQQSVSLKLPKFTLNTGDSYMELLSSMGLEKSLRAQTADFSSMLNPDLLLPTPVNDLFSVASLTIAESGVNTDAQAVYQAGADTEESVEITFDRPFLMAVTDTQTGALLAMGWVNTVNESR